MGPRRRHLPHLLLLAAGIAGGVRLALPVDAGGVTTVALGALLAWLVADLLLVHLPERRADAPRGHDHEAGEAVRAACCGVLPPPRRRMRPPEITVAAVIGGPPELRAVGPLDRPTPPAGRGIRVVAQRPGVPGPDGVLAACWDAATVRRARLLDAHAVALGLARAPLSGAAAPDPDPLLSAATWAHAAVPAPREAPRIGRRRLAAHAA